MKLNIGENIKELRHKKGITQDQLAAVLDVSNQSVSRWELGICYPDIELLPVIANYFNVTLDDLMGMQQIRSEATRNEIFTAAINQERQGNWQEAIEILRNALKTFPTDDGLQTELVLALSKTATNADRMEAITISEEILTRCTDEKLRSTLRANLCFLYKAAGFQDKAIAMGRTLPHIWECREMLMPDLASESTRSEMVTRAYNIAYQVLQDVAANNKISFSLGYKPEEHIDSAALMQYILNNT